VNRRSFLARLALAAPAALLARPLLAREVKPAPVAADDHEEHVRLHAELMRDDPPKLDVEALNQMFKNAYTRNPDWWLPLREVRLDRLRS
jgi:benzoyl-CoA reductase/2-hydroxyglutaryl-CoA dehydratase subunit BcrC/BadD/HgdB